MISHTEDLHRHIFAFGSPTATVFGHMVLGKDGEVLGYHNPNESRWLQREPDVLEFLSQSGGVTAQLRRHSSEVWIGRVKGGRCPLMLISALDGGAAQAPGPAIVINSIPKSGTYFTAKALATAGFPDSGFHLGGRQTVDDFRGLPDEVRHRNPHLRRLNLPVDLVPLIAPGTVTPAHIEHEDTVARLRSYGTHVIHLKRDLRNVIVSLYRFKLAAVDPVSDLDKAWRLLPEPQRMAAFLLYYADRDIAHLRSVALQVANQPALTFEDISEGKVADEVAVTLDEIRPGLSTAFAEGLLSVRGKKSSTLSSARSEWSQHWTGEIQAIFTALGLEDANRRLGYGDGQRLQSG